MVINYYYNYPTLNVVCNKLQRHYHIYMPNKLYSIKLYLVFEHDNYILAYVCNKRENIGYINIRDFFKNSKFYYNQFFV